MNVYSYEEPRLGLLTYQISRLLFSIYIPVVSSREKPIAPEINRAKETIRTILERVSTNERPFLAHQKTVGIVIGL
jgi:hypothetical protein